MGKKRHNIALLVAGFENTFVRQLCTGAMTAATETDSNLVVFPGKFINPPYYDKNITQYEYQSDTIFDYAQKTNFDIFLIDINTIGLFSTFEQKLEFLQSFGDAKIVLLTCSIDGYANICFDNKAGLSAGIRHLIRDHHCKKLGFMAGTLENADSIERYEVYKSVLTEFGMEVDPTMVGHGNFSEFCDEEVERLLDAHPDMDAMIFANDGMAIGGYRVFKKRGLEIGKDIHVMGFDDAPSAVASDPQLTTVSADAAGLGYLAVKSVEDFLAGSIDNIKIQSQLIKRQSCGCTTKDYSTIPFTVEDFKDSSHFDHVMGMVNKYIFAGNDYEKGAARIIELLEQTIKCVFESMQDDTCRCDETLQKLSKVGCRLNKMKLAPFTRPEKITFLFECLYRQMKMKDNGEHWQRTLSEAFQHIYHEAASYLQVNADKMIEKAELLNFVTTTFLRDVLNYAVADDILFSQMIDTLSKYGFESTYLLRLPHNQIVRKNQHPGVAETMLLKAYQIGDKTYVPASDIQLRPVKDLFTDLFADRDRQINAVAAMLFSGPEQYGVMIFEMNADNIPYITTGIYQTSAAIKTIELLKNKEENASKLKSSLKQLAKANSILDEISKSDPLTQLLNRRGFLEAVNRSVEKPKNSGRCGVVIFADLNNLKIINDRFGHEDGDFALRLAGSILKNSISENASIVARYGGDEFCAFYITEEAEDTEEKIRKLIADETEKQNQLTDKEYYVSISMGFCMFECGCNVILSDMLDKADANLYEDKKHKRASVYKDH